MEEKLPSRVMFDALKHFGINHIDAARVLLTGRRSVDGDIPRSRADDHWYLNRRIHVMPERVNPRLYSDFAASAQALTAQMVAHSSQPTTIARQSIVAYLTGASRVAMRQALDALRPGTGTIYGNAQDNIAALHLGNPEGRTSLYVLFLVATGCLQDAQVATDEVGRFLNARLVRRSSTLETVCDDATDARPHDVGVSGLPRLGLLRMLGTVARPPIHPLSVAAEGTVIGYLPEGDSIIADVERDVSRNHLRVWRDGAHWYAQGLGSTNGTMLLTGNDGGKTVLEPPRSARTHSAPPVEIHPGDTLALGATTRFLAMLLTD